jgi:2-polyprenyl-3-methyl-5-hydroxy-6-metoxy-1,4-benzoquinol methylase
LVKPEANGVAPDGSPVDVYRALPSEPDSSRIRSILNEVGSILDLGCGPGRFSNPLAAAGHRVVAVDDSAEMLSWVLGAETVLEPRRLS